jgi:hypothetical protein
MHLRPAAIALLLMAAHASAQTLAPGPGGVPMAPGPSQPHDYTPGGVGPGGVAVAPGRAARGVNMDRIGPGGGALAPGTAGSVGTGPTLRTPSVAPSSGGIRTTIRSKRHPGAPTRHHRKRRPAVSRVM